ncbi:hypothetical protein [Paraburkholderia susongensis]|uniref:hypothetical protein n=1 Tax=Paraburkholderia susongensis TaxID=1515439 RepID=UPI001FC94187|nr:hypothetical protein [Paraburkholderia susongensis]
MPLTIDPAVFVGQIPRADARTRREYLRRQTGTLGAFHGKKSNAIRNGTTMAGTAGRHPE